MKQLRIARVALKLVCTNTMGSFPNSTASRRRSFVLPPSVRKMQQLQQLRPAAAGVIEALIDDLLNEIAGGRL